MDYTALEKNGHLHILGLPGSWKTFFIAEYIKHNLQQKKGWIVLDLYWEYQQYLGDQNNVICINFGLKEANYSLPFFAVTQENKNQIVEHIIDFFIWWYGHEIFGPRIQSYAKYGFLTLAEFQWSLHLNDLVKLFTDVSYLTKVLEKVKTPELRERRSNTYLKLWDREKQEIIPYFTSKFDPFITNPQFSKLLYQQWNEIDIVDEAQKEKLIIVNFDQSFFGQKLTQFFCGLFLLYIKNYLYKTKNWLKIYLDNCEMLVSSTLGTLLKVGRKNWVDLVLSHQYIDQLTTPWSDLKKLVFGTVQNHIVFRLWKLDAQVCEKLSWKNNLTNLKIGQYEFL